MAHPRPLWFHIVMLLVLFPSLAGCADYRTRPLSSAGMAGEDGMRYAPWTHEFEVAHVQGAAAGDILSVVVGEAEARTTVALLWVLDTDGEQDQVAVLARRSVAPTDETERIIRAVDAPDPRLSPTTPREVTVPGWYWVLQDKPAGVVVVNLADTFADLVYVDADLTAHPVSGQIDPGDRLIPAPQPSSDTQPLSILLQSHLDWDDEINQTIGVLPVAVDIESGDPPDVLSFAQATLALERGDAHIVVQCPEAEDRCLIVGQPDAFPVYVSGAAGAEPRLLAHLDVLSDPMLVDRAEVPRAVLMLGALRDPRSPLGPWLWEQLAATGATRNATGPTVTDWQHIELMAAIGMGTRAHARVDQVRDARESDFVGHTAADGPLGADVALARARIHLLSMDASNPLPIIMSLDLHNRALTLYQRLAIGAGMQRSQRSLSLLERYLGQPLPDADPGPVAGDWLTGVDGIWWTVSGWRKYPMRFVQDDSRTRGFYLERDWHFGAMAWLEAFEVVGERKVRFEWRESDDKGWVEFTFSEDMRTFEGAWGHHGGGQTYRWRGHRVDWP